MPENDKADRARDILVALALLTRLPLPRLPDAAFQRQARVVWAFPLAGLIVGAATVGFWIAQGWNGAFMGGPGVYEIIPGFVAATIATVLVSLATRTEDLDRYAVAAD